MPYIEKKLRDDALIFPDNPGDLNFAITTIVNTYLRRKGLRYEHLNAAIGALECAKLELYRRVAAPYEDTKIAENGDVYSPKILVKP